MAQPSISNIQQKIEIDGAGSVAVTDIATDSNGNFVREVRVLGVIDADNPSAPLVFTLRLSSAAAANIQIATPAASF
jgi:hypothetical protein